VKVKQVIECKVIGGTLTKNSVDDDMIELVAVETEAENSRNASRGILNGRIPGDEKGYVRWLSGCVSDGKVEAANLRYRVFATTEKKHHVVEVTRGGRRCDMNEGSMVDAGPSTERDIDNNVIRSDLAERSRKVRTAWKTRVNGGK